MDAIRLSSLITMQSPGQLEQPVEEMLMTGWEAILLRLVIGLRVRGEAAGHISEGTLNLAFDRFAKIPTHRVEQKVFVPYVEIP